MKVPFNKIALSYEQQLQQLKDRGLIVDNDVKALHLLESISYYRLSGYWFPLLADKQNHLFKKDASLDKAFKLYCFDSELRKLMIAELEKIEVSIRAKMIYILSHEFGPFWFQQADLFKNPVGHAITLSKIGEELTGNINRFLCG